MEECAEGYTYFVVYGHSQHAVDVGTHRGARGRTEALDARRDRAARHDAPRPQDRGGRRVHRARDAHTVGIDAILNYKGYAGDKGLESYKGFEAYNLGAQVENEQLAERARALGADAILVSQVITQRNCHKENAPALDRAR